MSASLTCKPWSNCVSPLTMPSISSLARLESRRWLDARTDGFTWASITSLQMAASAGVARHGKARGVVRRGRGDEERHRGQPTRARALKTVRKKYEQM